jgi:hypothetical protein
MHRKKLKSQRQADHQNRMVQATIAMVVVLMMIPKAAIVPHLQAAMETLL